MTRALAVTAACLVLSVAGAVLAGVLLVAHVRGTSATGLLAAACGKEGSGCDAVITSRWGVFPPAHAEAGADAGAGGIGPPLPPPPGGEDATGGSRRGGIPVAALGLFYFSGLTVWFGALGVPGRGRRGRAVLLALCALGCVGSAWFIYVMAAHVKAWCPLCLGSHACNFLILAGVIVAGTGETPAAAGAGETARGPGARLAAVTAVLAVAVWVAEWAGYRALERDVAAGECDEIAAELEALKLDEEKLRALYLKQDQVDLQIEDGDPMIPNAKPPRMTLAFFSDIECPGCAVFDRFLFEKIEPLFNGHLRIVFKHYPLTSKHPNAFKAATALEAAHLQGKFWEAHDWLLDRRTRLAAVQYVEMATDLGIDPLQFVRDMNSGEAARQVREDMKLANDLGLTSTPAVFLNDRQVSSVLRKYTEFWQERAGSLRRSCEQSGLTW